MHTIARLFAAAAATVAFAVPAAAQTLANGVVRAPAAPATARVVATYRLLEARNPGLPVEVEIADRGGKLIATYRLARKGEARPMDVTVRDDDLLLSAGTPQGVLMLVLEGANDAAAAGEVRGRWTMGERSGDLRGWVRPSDGR
jgi:hypothetical protein